MHTLYRQLLNGRASLIAQLVKNMPATADPSSIPGLGKSSGEGIGYPIPCGSADNKSACNMEDLGLIPRLERSPGEGKGYPLQYAGLENSLDCIVHGITKNQTQLSDVPITSSTCPQSLYQS